MKGHIMKKLLAVSLLALSFATGFTCSKNAPEATPTQEQMGTPAPTEAPAAPADAAAPTEAAPAAPAEGTGN